MFFYAFQESRTDCKLISTNGFFGVQRGFFVRLGGLVEPIQEESSRDGSRECDYNIAKNEKGAAIILGGARRTFKNCIFSE